MKVVSGLRSLHARSHGRFGIDSQLQALLLEFAEDLRYPTLNAFFGEVDLVLEVEREAHEVIAPLALRARVQVAVDGPKPNQASARTLGGVGEEPDGVLVGVVVENLVTGSEERHEFAAQVELAERVELAIPGGLQLTYVPGAAADQDEVEVEHGGEIQALDVEEWDLHPGLAAHLLRDELCRVHRIAHGAAHEDARLDWSSRHAVSVKAHGLP